MLLNKHNLAIASHAAKSDLRPVLSAIYVTPEKTVATDAYRLLEVDLPKIEEKDTPEELRGSPATVLLPITATAKAEKNLRTVKVRGMPILEENVGLSVSPDGMKATMTTTDLATVDRVEARVIEGKYPDYEQIFPTSEPVARVRIDAVKLKEMADYFAKNTPDAGGGTHIVDVELYSPDSSDMSQAKPVVFRASTPAGQKIRGLIMPCYRN